MAVTNITNIDAADPVANIGAGGETLLKAAAQVISADDKRFAGLYVGQMAVEGFAVTIGLKYTIESPTVRLKVYALEAGAKSKIEGYLLIDSVMTLSAIRYL